MMIIIEWTPEDIVEFGDMHDRPVSTEAAEIGLVVAKERLLAKIVLMSQEWRTLALDNARGVRTPNSNLEVK